MSTRKEKPFRAPPQAGKPTAKPAKSGVYWMYGAHAVRAALANKNRTVRRLLVSKNAEARLDGVLDAARHPRPEAAEPGLIERYVGAEAVHQGIAAEVQPLIPWTLHELLDSAPSGPILMLDQVTDPHNVGAILRSSAAFGAAAVVVTANNAPPETAVMAKAACGALELVPLIHAGNLSQALELCKKAGYWCAGLDGEAKQALHETKLDAKTVLVLGAEGRGLRRLTAERCDLLVKLPISPAMESLNVSNAAAVALYELYRKSL